jgi:hypothetical protein
VKHLTPEQVSGIYELHQMNLPRKWIAWTFDIPQHLVNDALRLIGVPVSRKEISAERYVQLARMVNDEVPLTEIMRSLHMDSRTIYRWFPDYKPLPVGHSEGAKAVRDFRRLEKKSGLLV